jgi:hypothetical protein
MPIMPYLDGFSCNSETKRIMGVAFEMARAALRLADSPDPATTEMLAKSIIELAKDGVVDPDRLCEQALSNFRKTRASLIRRPSTP